MDDLVAWLRAQLDEEERVASAAPPGPWTTSGPDTISEWMIYDRQWSIASATAYDHNEPMSNRPGATGPGYIDANATAAHIVRYDPTRVLAEVDAKRRILELYDVSTSRELNPDGWELMKHAIRALGLPYADQPGYREEWRP